MKRSTLVIILVVMLGATMFGGGFLYEIMVKGYDPVEDIDLPDPTAVDVKDGNGVLAMDFKVQDAEGNEVSLHDFIGRPVVLNFWASWCDPCKGEMPGFQKQSVERGDEVVFLMVNLTDGSRETIATAQAFLAEAEYTFPVYYDTRLNAAATYGASSIPLTYFIDTQGYLVSSKMGMMSERQLEGGISIITTPRYYTIPAADVATLIEEGGDAVILDVRAPEDYAQGHLEGAISLPFDNILENDELGKLLPDPMQKIVVYCGDGRRSAVASGHLQNRGYFAVYDMGGLPDWEGELVQD